MKTATYSSAPPTMMVPSLFEVKALTDAGLIAIEAFTAGRGRWYDLTEKDLHDKLMNSSRYTHLPKYAKHLGIMPIKAA